MSATRAFGPGRVNLIGEHTDYNDGFCLPFAIAAGVTVEAAHGPPGAIEAHALDLRETDTFALADPEPADGWRAFVRGMVAELLGDADRVELGLEAQQLDLAPLHPRRAVGQQARRHAGRAQVAHELDRVLDEARAAELLVAQSRVGLVQRLRRVAPRLADRDQVQATVHVDVDLAPQDALVEAVAPVAVARAQVVELDARQLLVDRFAQPDEHLALEAGRVEERVVEVEDDRARQSHAQRAPGSFAG